MCAISINLYNWDWSESEGKRRADSFTAYTALVLCYVRCDPSVVEGSYAYYLIFNNSALAGILL